MENPVTPPNGEHLLRASQELGLPVSAVMATAALLAEGATVPFIARYRKERTGSLDEVQIAAVRDRLQQLSELEARRSSILASLQERNLLSPELQARLAAAETLTALEDLYLPFRPKRRTRGEIAKERGLEPLADILWAQDPAVSAEAAAEQWLQQSATRPPPAADSVNPSPSPVTTAEEALAGARDILAERLADAADLRASLRELYLRDSIVHSEVAPGQEEAGAKYRDYFRWQEPLAKAPSHRILAMRRGEKEGFLLLRIGPEAEATAQIVVRAGVRGDGSCSRQVRLAAEDAAKRLLGPAMETEARLDSKRRAEAEAIRVFATNLRELLLAPPLGRRVTLAIDPGFRTGCKITVLDPQGKLLHHSVIHPEAGQGQEARQTLLGLCARYGVEAVAIGNGTASRETEAFVRTLGLPPTIPVVMVNESGASIYSASEVAREEFPDQDLTVRGSVSIGRRLQDPLAELVKLDPKSIGVGQYQHDVDQASLKRSLDDVVVSCVNSVGVELNTASKQLLSYVSGIGPSLAEAIVRHRDAHGPFRNRRQLQGVPRLGPKAFEQCAGFLRIRDGEEPLDASAVHPESYPVVDAMARDLGCAIGDLLREGNLRRRIALERYVSGAVGLPTLQDIVSELERPGRDPRAGFEAFSFAEGVQRLEDLRPGMKLPGIVTNVTAFGAFVDIGVHQDGLVHVSQLADRFVKDPAEVVKPQQRVMATVLEVDLARQRVALSLRSQPVLAPRSAERPGAPSRPAGGTPAAGGGGRSAGRPAGRADASRSLTSDWFTQALQRGPSSRPRDKGGKL